MNWVENGNASVEFVCRADKKNVFLIGDSIRRGCCQTVKEELADCAEVFFVSDNCRSSQYIIFSIKKWAAMFDHPEMVDLVQFNCGQWDAAHFNGTEEPLTSLPEYARNIGMIIGLIRRFFVNAEIVFATTSKMNPDEESIRVAANPRTNAEIDAYNAEAVRVCRERGIVINDLNAFMADFTSDCFKDLCHLTPTYFAVLGREVARFLRGRLS